MWHGLIRCRQYPWVTPELLGRSLELIPACNMALKPSSNYIKMRQSSVANSATSARIVGTKCSRHFATRTINRGEQIMNTPTALGVFNRQETTQCYDCSALLKLPYTFNLARCSKMRFCSAECRSIAEGNYRKTMCGEDFGTIYKSAEIAVDGGDPAILALFWLLMLAYFVQKGGHPLQTPRMARLQVEYDGDRKLSWSFRANVVVPLQALKTFGIDIYADARYDL
jgi:hypothetical protein